MSVSPVGSVPQGKLALILRLNSFSPSRLLSSLSWHLACLLPDLPGSMAVVLAFGWPACPVQSPWTEGPLPSSLPPTLPGPCRRQRKSQPYQRNTFPTSHTCTSLPRGCAKKVPIWVLQDPPRRPVGRGIRKLPPPWNPKLNLLPVP